MTGNKGWRPQIDGTGQESYGPGYNDLRLADSAALMGHPETLEVIDITDTDKHKVHDGCLWSIPVN